MFEFAITLEEDLEVAAGEPISRGNIADGRVQPHGVVMGNEALDKASGILLGLLVLALMYLGLAIFVLIVGGIASVQSVPRELVTVSRVYGADRWQIIREIYLPAMAPIKTSRSRRQCRPNWV